MRHIMNISLPANMAKMVKSEVKKGNFASTSEFFRHLIREYQANALLAELDEERKEFEAGKGIELKSLKDLDTL